MTTSPKKKPKKKSSSLFSRPNNEETTKKANRFLALSGLAFELLLVIGLGVWGGWKLDQVFETTTPTYLLIGSFLSLLMAFVYLYRKLPK